MSRGELHGGIRTCVMHKFRELSGLPLEDQGVVVLQVGPAGMPTAAGSLSATLDVCL